MRGVRARAALTDSPDAAPQSAGHRPTLGSVLDEMQHRGGLHGELGPAAEGEGQQGGDRKGDRQRDQGVPGLARTNTIGLATAPY